jgi:hypothetical protein
MTHLKQWGLRIGAIATGLALLSLRYFWRQTTHNPIEPSRLQSTKTQSQPTCDDERSVYQKVSSSEQPDVAVLAAADINIMF